jgi:hypothetical protein
MKDVIEEEVAFLEALSVPDQVLIQDGVTDPEDRYQILYLSILLSMAGENLIWTGENGQPLK